MVPGDVPLNLNATSLITNAYLYTATTNTDSGCSTISRRGWTAPRPTVGSSPTMSAPPAKSASAWAASGGAATTAGAGPTAAASCSRPCATPGCNATLLTGDPSWLDLFRSQADRLWDMRRREDGQLMIPNKHGDQGWFEYVPHASSDTLRLLMHAYAVGRQQQDLDRIDQQYGDRPSPQDGPLPGCGKAGSFRIHEWFEYTVGRNPDFPARALEITHAEMRRRLDRIDSESLDWTTWRDEPDWQDVHHWQEINPVIPEGLMQMAMGTPTAVYHGGMVHAALRYFDPAARRPGLPPGVAALVDRVETDHIHLHLVNTDILESREVILQAGGCAEHEFTQVRPDDSDAAPTPIDGRHIRVRLGPAAQGQLRIGLQRLTHRPTYAWPAFD